MSELESMLMAAVDHDEGPGADFVARRGHAVARSVRRRRRLRAAGAGGAVAAVGTLAFAGAQLVGPREPVPAASLACVPVAESALRFEWPERPHDEPALWLNFYDGQDSIEAELREDALTIVILPRDVGESLTIEVEDGALVGVETDADGRGRVAMPSGREIGVGLVWTEDLIRLEVGTSEDAWASSEKDLDPAPPPLADRPYLLFEADDVRGPDEAPAEPTWVLLDGWAGRAALEITGSPNDEVTVHFPDGSTTDVASGPDGVVAFTWTGVTDVSLAAEGSTATGDQVSDPIDAIVSGPPICEV